MPFQAACPACNAKINVPDNMAGKKAKCPKCQNVFVLPGGSAPAPIAAADDMDFEAAPARGGRGNGGGGDGPSQGGGSNGLAIAGMVLGIVGVVLVWIPCIGQILAIVLGIVGAALSGIGLAQANKSGSGKGMALTGLILSILAMLVAVLYWAYIAFMVNTAANQFQNEFKKQLMNQKDIKINFNDAFKDMPNFPK
ncbi:MAG: hypothetical protein U0744_01510 [Gemmataceae bacterium]